MTETPVALRQRPTVNVADYDIILVNTSGGKDSQTMLGHVVDLARQAGVEHRLVAVHADLGRVEWAGTAELAEAQADSYGVRFIKVSRPQGDLLDHIEARGMFPDNSARYCTSDHKRGQVYKAMTALVKEQGLNRPVRILNCMGLRAQESPARAKKPELIYDKKASGKGEVRQVWTWLPILHLTADQVWADIARRGVPHHRAYDLGMPRLSCCFCVLSSKSALVLAAQHNPELAAEYVAVEARIGHTFRKDLTMAQIVAEAAATTPVQVEDWVA